MKFKRTILSFVAAVVLIPACTDNSGLESRLDELEGRVQALENVVAGLNDNIAALQSIAEGKTINKVELVDGVYVITLSNGDVLKLTQGSVGIGKAPLLSIDSQGYWMVDYQDGNGSIYLTREGSNIVGVGNDGVTPVLGVDSSGFWTVDYSDGRGPVRVLDVNGKPVKAVADDVTSDSYFANVEVTDEMLTLTLKNGQKYTAPVIGSFLFKINADESDQTFKPGESKTYGIEKKGVASATVIAPHNWNATLSGMILTVTAPSEIPTKATLADSRKDLSVIAFADNGYSTVAKIKVYLEGMVYPGEIAAAGIVLAEASATTLTFRVILENASGWKYMFVESGTAAPSVTTVDADGLVGTETTLVFDNLKPETRYSLYVLPYNTDGNGALTSLAVRTTSYSNLYEAYNAGMDINIGGKTINKSVYGPARLLSASNDKIANGVNFIPSEVTASVENNTFVDNVIIVGNTPGTRSKLNLTGQMNVSKADALLAFKNLEVSWDASYVNSVVWSNYEVNALVIDDCKVNGMNRWLDRSQTGIKEIIMIDSDYKVISAPYPVMRGLVLNMPLNYEGERILLQNNVVYGVDNGQFYICAENGANKPASATFKKVEIMDNTFYQCYYGGDGMVSLGDVTSSITITGNLSWTYYGNLVLFRLNACNKTQDQLKEFATISNNKLAGYFIRCGVIIEGTGDSGASLDASYGGTWYNMSENYPFVKADPVAAEDFSVSSEFAGYGATR